MSAGVFDRRAEPPVRRRADRRDERCAVRGVDSRAGLFLSQEGHITNLWPYNKWAI